MEITKLFCLVYVYVIYLLSLNYYYLQALKRYKS